MTFESIRANTGLEPIGKLASLPTPFHRLDRISDDIGHEVFIKRDDLTGLALGGNKARKLTWLMAKASQDEMAAIVTAGAAQSNHARMSAAAAATLGMECHLVLEGPPDDSGNALLDRLFGARIHWVQDAGWHGLNSRVDEVADELTASGTPAMAIAMGGATPVGCLGYVMAALELADDITKAGMASAEIFFASGTGGTHAGLEVGLEAIRAAGMPVARLDLRAVAVAQPEQLPDAVARLASRTSPFLGIEREWSPIAVETRYFGEKYGVATPGALAAIRYFAELEGILLDPVYTGKAADALLAECRSGNVTDPAVLLHTGGAPALFADSNRGLFPTA